MGIADLKLPNKPFTEFNRAYMSYVLSSYFDHVLQVRGGEKYKGFHKKLAVSPTFTYNFDSDVLRVSSVRKVFKRGKDAGSEEIMLDLWYSFDSILPEGSLGSSMRFKRRKPIPLAYKSSEQAKLISILRPLGYRLRSFCRVLKSKELKVSRDKNSTTVSGVGEYGDFELVFTSSGNLNVMKSRLGSFTGVELKERVNKGEL